MRTAVEDLGSLDIVVNNAGITRDKMLFNLTDEDWDLVVAVHLRGHFLLTRNAAAHWRALSKQTGEKVNGSIINTSSEAALLGPPAQANYGAAKAGITALTVSAARGLGRIGARANAICPRARTPMTADVFGEAPQGNGGSAGARACGAAGQFPLLGRRRKCFGTGFCGLRSTGDAHGTTDRRSGLFRGG